MEKLKSAVLVGVLLWLAGGILLKLGTGTPAMDLGRFACVILLVSLVFYRTIPAWATKIILTASWMVIAIAGFAFGMTEFKVISVGMTAFLPFGWLIVKGHMAPIPREVEDRMRTDFWK